MAPADLFLIGFALFAIAIAGGAGWGRPEWLPWKWIDLIYYPLGSIGVVLFFLASATDRKLVHLREASTALNRELARHPDLRPRVRFEPTSSFTKFNYDMIMLQRRTGDSCRALPSHPCIAYSDHADAIDTIFKDFVADWESSDTEKRVRTEQNFCKNVYALIDRLDTETFNGGAYDVVKRHLQPLRDGVPTASVEDVERDIKDGAAMLLNASSKPDRPWVEERLRIESAFAVQLFKGASACALRPTDEVDKLKQLDRWRAEDRRLSTSSKALKDEIAKAKSDEALIGIGAQAKSAGLRYWPFILILALALKFGKAVAGIASERRKKRDLASAQCD